MRIWIQVSPYMCAFIVAACSLNASETASKGGLEQAQALFPGYRVEKLTFDSNTSFGVPALTLCGPFEDFVQNQNLTEIFGDPLDNASVMDSEEHTYFQPFEHFALKWTASTNQVTVASIGESACAKLSGQACLKRTTPVGNESTIGGVTYAHGFAAYLQANPTVVSLLGPAYGGAFLYNQRGILRQHFQHGALEFNISEQRLDVAPLGREDWQSKGFQRSAVPGLCFQDSTGARQTDFAVYEWDDTHPAVPGVDVFAVGTLMNPSTSAGLCSNALGIVLCGGVAIVGVVLAGYALIAKLTADSPSKTASSSSQVYLTDDVRLWRMLVSVYAGVNARTVTPLSFIYSPAITPVYQPPIAFHSDRGDLIFGQPLPRHMIPSGETLDDQTLRDALYGHISGAAFPAANIAADIDSVLAQLSEQERKYREMAYHLDQGALPWLDEVSALTDDELAEFEEQLGMSVEELRAWMEQAKVWVKEENRQASQTAEAFADVLDHIRGAATVATAAYEASENGGNVEAAVENMAQEFVDTLTSQTTSPQALDEALTRLESLLDGSQFPEQYEEICRRAIELARQRLGL